MGKTIQKKCDEKEKQSKAVLWFEKYKDATSHLSCWEKQCLLLTTQPISDAMERVLKGVMFKTFDDAAERNEAFIYEELRFFMPKVIKMCGKIRKKTKSILYALNIPGNFTRK